MARDHNHVPGSRCCQHDIFEGESLWKAIHHDGVSCLNERNSGSAKRILKPYSDRCDKSAYCESGEADPEMILSVPFTTTVRIKSLCLSSEPGPATPHVARLFINKPALDFETANDGKPEHEIRFNGDGDPDASMWHQLQVGRRA